MPQFKNINAIPTGGAFSLTFTTVSGAPISLSRAVSGSSSYTTIYSGAPLTYSGVGQYVLDYGDNGVIDPATFYVYRLIDTSGTVISDPVQSSGTLMVETSPITEIVMKLMQSGLTNLATPTGIATPLVTFQMPQGGFPPLPYIVIFPVLLQQEAQKIGTDVDVTDDNNVWVINELARQGLQISILCRNAEEMLFYRNATIGIFKLICAEVLSDLGLDTHHNYIASATQSVAESESMSPGFFEQDILCEFTGIFNISITRSYGVVETIDTIVSDGDEVIVDIVIPP